MSNIHNILVKIIAPLLLGLACIVAQGCGSSDEGSAPTPSATGTVKISGTSNQ